MSINYKIWDFPASLKVQSQLFYPAGQAFEGGFTSGGVNILSPEPGGRSYLETLISLQTKEWDYPFTSWLMGKLNGDIFRVRMTATPQLVNAPALGFTGGYYQNNGILWAGDLLWGNDQPWELGDTGVPVTAVALEGSLIIYANFTGIGQVLKHGHAFGIGDTAYAVDDIEWTGNVAKITCNPPLRRDISTSDILKFRPSFLGRITNGGEMRTMYERANNGHIQPGRILFSEVIL